MTQFDESKIKRDDDGRFAEKPPAPEEIGVELASADGPAEPALSPEGRTLAGMDAPATTEAQKRLPGAVISDERPKDEAMAAFAGHGAQQVDEAFSHLTPKVRHDVDGNPYESITDQQMEQVSDMFRVGVADQWNHDCRECGRQLEDNASPDIKGSCNDCSGLYELEDQSDFGIEDGTRLGSYMQRYAAEEYGEEVAQKAADRMYPNFRRVSNDRGETDRQLDDDEQDAYYRHCEKLAHGTDPDVHVGSRTPWGKADNVERVAPGIVFAGTPSHGGYKLSRERNAAIPPALRERSGWYDEDDGRAVVHMYHPDSARPREGFTRADVAAEAAVSIRDHRPAAYEKATGTTIPFGVSSGKDKADYYADKKGQVLVYSIGGREDPENPGFVKASTRVHGDSQSGFGTHLVPKDAYDSLERSHGSARDIQPVLPPGSRDVSPPPKVSTWVKPPGVTTFTTAGQTPAAAARMAKDLGQRWRGENGEVRSLGQLVERGEITAKTSYVDNGRRSYALTAERGESHTNSYRVTKATFDAFDGPDDRSESLRAYQDMEVERTKWEAAREDFRRDRRGEARIRAAYEKADADYQASVRRYEEARDS